MDTVAGWVRAPFPKRIAANALPGRGYPEEPGEYNFLPPVGGAHGPSSIPSRLVNPVPAAPIATAGGAFGPSAQTRRGAVVIMAGRSPGLQGIGELDNELLHGSIRWNRPRYENAAGRFDYMAPTGQPSWAGNEPVGAGPLPASAIPVQEKQITNFTVRKPFGDSSTGELSAASYGKEPGVPIKLPYYGIPGSPTYPTPSWMVRRPQQGRQQQLRRWRSQAQTRRPITTFLTRWGQAGSYGQTTMTLPTSPVNTPANSYGAY